MRSSQCVLQSWSTSATGCVPFTSVSAKSLNSSTRKLCQFPADAPQVGGAMQSHPPLSAVSRGLKHGEYPGIIGESEIFQGTACKA